MATSKGNPGRELQQLKADLERVAQSTRRVIQALGGDVGNLVERELLQGMERAQSIIGSLGELYGASKAAVSSAPRGKPGRPKGSGRKPGRPKGSGRKPGRPKGSGKGKGKAVSKPAAPAKGKKARRGVRGVSANLSAAELQAALKKTGGVKSRAAKGLGVTITTFNKYLDRAKRAGEL